MAESPARQPEIPNAAADGSVSKDTAAAGPKPPRLLSLDALRGATMIWLIGLSEIVQAATAIWLPAYFDAVETQLTHPRWRGFVFWDMIMPVFLFVVGAAMPFAMANRTNKPLSKIYFRIGRRVLLLWTIGVVLNQVKNAPVVPELMGNALQAIAIGYLVASVALLHLRLKGQLALFAILTVGYWALLTFVPFNGHAAGTLEKNCNFALYIDKLVLDVFRRNHSFTWIVTSMGFSASVLLGTMAGRLLKTPLPSAKRLLWFAVIGLALMAAGWAWSYSIPFNRYLWTSSLILWTGGWGFLLVGAFHAVIDVWGLRRWAFPFIVIGSNALLAYSLDPFLIKITRYLVSFLPIQWNDYPQHFVLTFSSIELVAMWLFLWYLYRRRLFFRA